MKDTPSSLCYKLDRESRQYAFDVRTLHHIVYGCGLGLPVVRCPAREEVGFGGSIRVTGGRRANCEADKDST